MILIEKYKTNVIPNLIKKFKYTNIQQVPKLIKITLNTGLGLKAQNPDFIKKVATEISLITGQYPALTRAKKSVSSFKIRSGYPLGLYLTLRKLKMYTFLEKLILFALPRVRDFRGLNSKSFDKFGNYTFGISDNHIFPEIENENLELKYGFNITIGTSASSVVEAYNLLNELGFPFTQTK